MENPTHTESELKPWLLSIFKKDNIKDLSLKIVGKPDKGDNYVGDILFVQASLITEDNLTKNYDLVLKCSKKSKMLRQASPVKEAFYNEIFIYNTILPYFIQFQLEKGVENPFNSFPKCYGTFVDENTEIIVLENLKTRGYDLWPKKNPVTRKHIDLVLEEYAKYHAISAALGDQRPDKLEEFGNALTNMIQKVLEWANITSLYEHCIDQVADMLQEEIEEADLLKWRDFKKQIHYIFYDLFDNVDGVKVILHGDCWNNNFMYKYKNGDKNVPTTVSILDFQLSQLSSPILDISYHIFTCISEEDLEDLDTILKNYYKIFSQQVKLLGSDPEVVYPFQQFLKDWQKFSKTGILTSVLMAKSCSAEEDEIVDLAQCLEKGEDFLESANRELKSKENYKRRIRPIVKYALKNNLI